MKDRHPIIVKWAVARAESRESWRRGKGGDLWGFNNLAHRQHRILSRIFFIVEKHDILPNSLGWPDFHFEFQGTITNAFIGPIDPHTTRDDADLRFLIVDPNSDGSAVYAEWSDGDARLEDKISEISDAILAAVRAAARAKRQLTESLLEAELLHVLSRLKELKEARADGYAARVDPRAFQYLAEMAERHRTAVLVRRFLRALAKTIGNGSVVVADYSLDDWMMWATAKADEHDPMVQGPEDLFEKLAKS